MKSLDPASYNFKRLLHRVVSDTFDSIPAKLLDLELGIPDSNLKPDDSTQTAQQAQQAQQAEQPMETDEAQQAQQAQQEDSWNFDDSEEGRLRLPLFTGKVMAFVQYLLQYKVQPFANWLMQRHVT